ncbi:MAG: hypothetical protein QHH06_05810 [Clostridiales bacterium]|nr:hypothetical protein [Eubacteriales bacterium]MDH7565981.1 hypothetical protein [Clostridiales bacterium]
MSKLLQFKIQEAASFFYNNEVTDNEMYLLNLLLDVGKEYNKLVEEYNKLVCQNQMLNRLLLKKSSC